jgi:uncharacterized surface protein with fasciclin (FAS1) repeats
MGIQMVTHSRKMVAAALAIAACGSLAALPTQAKPADPAGAAAPGMAQSGTTQPSTTQPTMTKPSGTKPAAPAKPAPAKTAGTIVDVAAANGSFKTLVKAVKAAGLAETLSGKGPFTVFAPTDAAFAALPKGTLETLLKPENKEKLKKVLTYHVVSGSVMSTAIKPGKVNTVEGSPVTLAVAGKTVMVNSAKVTAADVKASNGVIHVIDKVLLPPGL